jgi:hypothetical protein
MVALMVVMFVNNGHPHIWRLTHTVSQHYDPFLVDPVGWRSNGNPHINRWNRLLVCRCQGHYGYRYVTECYNFIALLQSVPLIMNNTPHRRIVSQARHIQRREFTAKCHVNTTKLFKNVTVKHLHIWDWHPVFYILAITLCFISVPLVTWHAIR